LSNELDRLNNLYQNKVKDNEELRNRCNALESEVVKKDQLER